MERKPPRHSDGHPSSRPASRGPRRPRSEGDARPPRRENADRFRDREDRPGDRFENRGPRTGPSTGSGPRSDGADRGGRPWGDNRGGRDFSERPAYGDRPAAPRPPRAEWQNNGDRPRNDRPRDDRGDRNDRPRGERDRFDRNDRPRDDRMRFDQNDRGRFGDRRPRNDDRRPPIDDDAGNRVDYTPPRQNAGRFDNRGPRKGGFDRGDSAPRHGDSAPRFRDNDRTGRDRPRDGQEKPRKERYQVWNKELPPLDDARGDRSTLKLANKGDNLERKLYGVNACQAFFARRPQDIIRAYFTESVARQHFGDVMKFLAQEKLAYHLVPADDMERITESTHHEGVCLLVRDQPAESFFHWLETNPTAATETQCILALEDIGNPHNVGAIMRVAAHFGAKAVVVKEASLARSGAAMRTAEGGAEHVKLLEADDFERMLSACRREGYTVVSTSSHRGTSLFDTPLPARVVILFGQESKGLSTPMQDSSDIQVCIPGTKQVESLNVSVAAGILLAEYWRHHGR